MAASAKSDQQDFLMRSQTMKHRKMAVAFGTLCSFVLCLSESVFAQAGIASSVCSLPVVSTVVLEYPIGSPHTTVILTSDPEALPTVYTGSLRSDQTMDSIFVALDLSGTYDKKPLKAKLNGDFKESKGQLVKIALKSGKFAGGHHVLDVYQLYTFNAGGKDAVEVFNKDPITLEADIASNTPSGRVYKMTSASPALLYDHNDPTRVVAKLYSLENQVK
jgi:hypothetical protein